MPEQSFYMLMINLNKWSEKIELVDEKIVIRRLAEQLIIYHKKKINLWIIYNENVRPFLAWWLAVAECKQRKLTDRRQNSNGFSSPGPAFPIHERIKAKPEEIFLKK